MQFHTVNLIRNPQVQTQRSLPRPAVRHQANTSVQTRDHVAIRSDLFTPSHSSPQEAQPKPTAKPANVQTSEPSPSNGNVVYRSGLDVVTMNPDGTLGMSIAEDNGESGFVGALQRGLESSGTVLQHVMMDAANLGSKFGRALGVDEKAPGFRGAVGTAVSAGAALVGGLVALPLATIAGLVDAVGG